MKPKLGVYIKKQADDGCIIEEYYDPKKGRYNKYYYGKKRAPQVKLTDKISQQFAAYTLIEKDLRSVIFWLEQISLMKPNVLDRTTDPMKMNLIKGLFVAALTFYAKCFTSCEGRKVKLESKHVPDDLLKVHEDIMKLRHNFAAHSGAENFEEVQVSLVLHPNKSKDIKPQLFTELAQPDFIGDSELPFLELAHQLQKVVWNKRKQVGDVVMQRVVRAESKSYWYKKAKQS
ncbi:hypothetical protein [Vibrio proteolyticus]|uniref:Uncharacterized protein n=1 Tax=Vibrio proteolyticus NBRC 13287 TaxID=1219065 RepID=U3BLD1_VIBPR|nr:hypothetical protein [Vibrio proteolyticus]GAD67418.1 hypothetical protein VPR01S_08_00020 [Vibrio proteolyticus NBRC 13287]